MLHGGGVLANGPSPYAGIGKRHVAKPTTSQVANSYFTRHLEAASSALDLAAVLPEEARMRRRFLWSWPPACGIELAEKWSFSMYQTKVEQLYVDAALKIDIMLFII